jgi:acyl-CoA synthetase (AMP-forming)/AMP-acid ligase II
MVCPYPLFHMGAWTIALQQWQGRDRVVFSGTDAVSVLDAIERHRAYRMNAIPAIWRRVLDHLTTPEGKARDLSCLRFVDSGTSATPIELLEAMAAAFPTAQVRVFYGATESGGVTGLSHADISRKPGSCGVPAPTARVRIDEHGELWASGPMLFDGYFGNPEATAEVLVDGWYRSGDLAEFDDEGYVSIVGRAKDVIRSGGETVAPTEVEHVLGDHPAVADVAVVGIPDVQWGEVVCAVLVLVDGHDAPTVEELRAHCTGRLATFKHPRRVEVTGEIPKTASTGQIRRALIVQQLA